MGFPLSQMLSREQAGKWSLLLGLQGDGGLSLPEELHWPRRGQHPQLFYGQRALG